MTTDEIERLAASLEEMPDGLDTPDQMLFLVLRELYGNFRSGYVNRERAKREKSRIYVAYYELKNQYTVMEQHLGIRRRLQNTIGDVYQCGCANCRKLLNVFVGIDREDIPTDIKEINALNEKLREMVKERSERNAYLATVIDRIRWALEKNDIERAREIINDHRDN
jgi:hypothetical protein